MSGIIPQIRPLVIPEVKQTTLADPGAFGLTAAKATTQGAENLGKTADKVADIAADIAWQDDRAKAKAAVVQLDTAIRDSLYSTDSQNPGYMGKTGQIAVSALDSTQKGLETKKQEIFASLQNERQQKWFEEQAQHTLKTTFDGMARHSSSQHRAYLDTISSSVIDNSVQNAIAEYSNPERLELARQELIAETANMGKRQGLPPEAIQENLRRNESLMHSKVLARMAEANPAQAQEYYDNFRNHLWGDDAIKAEKIVKGAVFGDEVRKLTDWAISQFGYNQEALDAIRKESDPQTATRAEAELMRRHSHNETLKTSTAREVAPGIADEIIKQSGGKMSGINDLLGRIKDGPMKDAVVRRLDDAHRRNEHVQNEERRDALNQSLVIFREASSKGLPLSIEQLPPELRQRYEWDSEFQNKLAPALERGKFPPFTRPEITQALNYVFVNSPDQIPSVLKDLSPQMAIKDHEAWKKKIEEHQKHKATAWKWVDSPEGKRELMGIFAANSLGGEGDGAKNTRDAIIAQAHDDFLTEIESSGGKVPDAKWINSRVALLAAKADYGNWTDDQGYKIERQGKRLEEVVQGFKFEKLAPKQQSEVREELKGWGIAAPSLNLLNDFALATVKGGTAGDAIRKTALAPYLVKEIEKAKTALKDRGLNEDAAYDLVLTTLKQQRGQK